VIGTGGIGDGSASDQLYTDSAVEWCARDSNNQSAMHGVALLWPHFPPITNIVSSDDGTTATVTTDGATELQNGDEVSINQVSSYPDGCYDTLDSMGNPVDVPITYVSSDSFSYTPSPEEGGDTCSDTYVSGGSISMWPPEIDMVETNGGNQFQMTYHYLDTDTGLPTSCTTSKAVTDVPLQDFNVFELLWTSTTLTLYANGTSVQTLSTSSGSCSGVSFPHVGMTFDFDQENTANVTVGNTNQQTNLAWVAFWNS
jgi:Glycosyl hydrolases family 16